MGPSISGRLTPTSDNWAMALLTPTGLEQCAPLQCSNCLTSVRYLIPSPLDGNRAAWPTSFWCHHARLAIAVTASDAAMHLQGGGSEQDATSDNLARWNRRCPASA